MPEPRSAICIRPGKKLSEDERDRSAFRAICAWSALISAPILGALVFPGHERVWRAAAIGCGVGSGVLVWMALTGLASRLRGNGWVSVQLLPRVANGLTFLALFLGGFAWFSPGSGSMQDRGLVDAPGAFLGAFGAGWLRFCLVLAAALAVLGHWLLRPESLPRFLRNPARLPRLRPHRGVTLIELLIVVAILAIFSFGLLNFTRVVWREAALARDAKQAVLLARNEIERLRAGVGKLEAGTWDITPSAEDLPQTLTVEEPRGDGLVPVTVCIQIGDYARHETIEFSALIRSEDAS